MFLPFSGSMYTCGYAFPEMSQLVSTGTADFYDQCILFRTDAVLVQVWACLPPRRFRSQRKDILCVDASVGLMWFMYKYGYPPWRVKISQRVERCTRMHAVALEQARDLLAYQRWRS